MKKLILGAFLLALPLSGAHAMNIATFLQKADALEKKGVLALMSSDYKLLKGEVQRSSEQLRAERVAAEKAGRKPGYCPTQAKGGLEVKELLAHFRAIPPQQRARTEVKDGLRSLLVRKFPCR